MTDQDQRVPFISEDLIQDALGELPTLKRRLLLLRMPLEGLEALDRVIKNLVTELASYFEKYAGYTEEMAQEEYQRLLREDPKHVIPLSILVKIGAGQTLSETPRFMTRTLFKLLNAVPSLAPEVREHPDPDLVEGVMRYILLALYTELRNVGL